MRNRRGEERMEGVGGGGARGVGDGALVGR